MDCSTPGFPVHHQLPKLAQTHVQWVGDAIQPSHPLSFPSLPAFNLSQHQCLFQWVLHIRWPKYWSFSFSISPSNEYSGLISFRIDLLDLLAVQGTLKSLLQHHSFSLLLSYSTSQYYLPTSIPPFSFFPWLQSFQVFFLLQLLPGSSSKFWSCCSVAKSCPTLCNPMDWYMPDSSVLHFLPEFAQIHVHWIS